MSHDEVLDPWWNDLDEEARRRWRQWQGLEPVPDDLASQLSRYLRGDDIGRFLFWRVVPDTSPPVNQRAATERLAVFIERKREER